MSLGSLARCQSTFGTRGRWRISCSPEAEDWRQLRLHALEALAQRLTAQGHYGDAAAAALAAVRAEPLRESPRAALIRVHIAEGNPSEALREFARYGELLMLELGIEPTERLRALVANLGVVTPR
jgi:DNA-binding SARP family transcriptional activator